MLPTAASPDFTVFPAIDLMGGQVVRLHQGDPSQKTVYSDDPAATARRWLEGGATWLHVVNLDAAFGEPDYANLVAIAAILEEANLFAAGVQLGGGLRTVEAVQEALGMGVRRVVVGTMAVEEPDTLLRLTAAHGPEAVAAGIDARDGVVRVRGWKQGAEIRALELAKLVTAHGVRWMVVTDIRRDGSGSGVNVAACVEITQETGARVIASGGVQGRDDIEAARQAGLAGIIAGRALYDGSLSIEECF
jgi:phosphoribosylformimino-5-aminoimidazole carboxamide ribotide isomerase